MKQKETKKNARKRNILLVLVSLFVVLALAAGFVVYRNYSAIAGFLRGMQASSEDLQSQKEQNDQKQQELLNDLVPAVTFRDLTDEERAMLESGLLSEEEALALIRGETLAPTPSTETPAETTAVPVETTVPTSPVTEAVATEPVTTAQTTAQTTAETTAASSDTVSAGVAAALARQEEIIAEIYLLRATYLTEIDKLIQGAKQEYLALPKEERSLAAKMKIVEKLIPKGNKLEDECDAKMEALLSELTSVLQAQGLPTDVVAQIRATYKEQKEIKLAELYQAYGGKLEQ